MRPWFKFYRDIQQKPVWMMPPLYLKVWFWILCNVDEATGSIQTSLDKIAEDIAWDSRSDGGGYKKPSRPTVKRAVHNLASVGSITYRSLYRSFTEITVVNWANYQSIPNDVTGNGDGPVTANVHLEVDSDSKSLALEVDSGSENVQTSTPEEPSGSKKPDPDIRVEQLFKLYKRKINPKAKLTSAARKKIASRLKEFDPKEIQTAILNFSQDWFSMDRNFWRVATWFFHSEERILGYVNMVPRTEEENRGSDPRFASDDADMAKLRANPGKPRRLGKR